MTKDDMGWTYGTHSESDTFL